MVASARAAFKPFRDFTDEIFGNFDLIVLPTVLAPAPSFAEFQTKSNPWIAMRTIPFNVTGQPAISLPMGFADGLPLGLQIVGALGADEMVLDIAARFENATDHAVMSPYFC